MLIGLPPGFCDPHSSSQSRSPGDAPPAKNGMPSAIEAIPTCRPACLSVRSPPRPTLRGASKVSGSPAFEHIRRIVRQRERWRKCSPAGFLTANSGHTVCLEGQCRCAGHPVGFPHELAMSRETPGRLRLACPVCCPAVRRCPSGPPIPGFFSVQAPSVPTPGSDLRQPPPYDFACPKDSLERKQSSGSDGSLVDGSSLSRGSSWARVRVFDRRNVLFER